MTHTISDKKVMINGSEHIVTAVNGMDRVEINNKLHEIGDQILKLRMQQSVYVEMRSLIDDMNKEDLFTEMFGIQS
jgi:hypothetical protein